MKTENESGFIKPPHIMEHSEGITGMSEIYVSQSGFFRISIARHLGRKVVVKSLKPDCSSNPLALQQLNKEFALAFPVESPYVCRVLASVSLPDGTPAIEMEFCKGDSLRSLYDRAYRFTPCEASGIVNTLLLGLKDIHRMGVVHRDIKPSNIIFDRDNRSVKIIDFGCAHSYDYISLSGPAGTIPYTPPEKRHGSVDPHPGDDLFAAGLVIMELAGSCTDRKMSRRLRFFGKALSSRRFSTADEALDYFNRSTKAKSLSLLLIALPVIILTAIGLFLLLSPRSGDDSIAVPATPTAGIVPEIPITTPDSMLSATDSSPDDGPTVRSTDRTASPDAPAPPNNETSPITVDIPAATKESDRELRLIAVQAGPMALRAKEHYASDDLRDNAFAITSADSIYMHHLYKDFPKGSLTDESLSIAIDSIYTAECQCLENKYLRIAGKPLDQHRFKIIFMSRLEYMLK